METVTVDPRLARGRTTNKTTFRCASNPSTRVAPLRLGPLGMSVEPVDPALPFSEGHSHGDHDVALAAEKANGRMPMCLRGPHWKLWRLIG